MNKIATLIVLFGLSAQPVLAHEIGADVGVSAEVETGLNASLESETTAGSHDENETAIEIVANPVVVTQDTEDTGVTVTSSSQVSTETDLSAYTRAVVKAHADISDVSLTTREVTVRHRSSAKLFGLFPITVFARTTVSSNGKVKVKFPWYASAKAKKTALEARIHAAVESSVPSTNPKVSAELNARSQADILAKTVAAIEAEAAAEASASVQ